MTSTEPPTQGSSEHVTQSTRAKAGQPFASLNEVISRLHLATSIPLGASLDEPVDARTLFTPLEEGVIRLRAMLERPERVVSLTTLEAAREAWAQRGPDLHAVGERNARILCADHETATTRAFVNELARADALRDKPRWRDAMIRSYFHGWRTMDDPESLEALLRASIAQSRRGTARFEALRAAASQLFSSFGASVVADRTLTTGRSLDEVLPEVGASRTGGFGRSVAGEVLVRWVRAFCVEASALDETIMLERFRMQAAVRLSDSHVPAEALGHAVDMLVAWPRTIMVEAFKQELEDTLVRHPRLGDPRLLHSRGNWDVCPEARDVVVRWLSRRDLAFFFDFVMDQTADPHGRKEFWSRYIDQVMDSSVALCLHDEYRLRVQVKDRISHARVTGSKDVSAFLMRFASASHLLFVEFSQPGNALYVLNLQKFERAKSRGIRSSTFDLREDLKGTAFEESFTHWPTPGWQEVVADYLRTFGIRPTVSPRN